MAQEQPKKSRPEEPEKRQIFEPPPAFWLSADDALAVPALRAYRTELQDHGHEEAAREIERLINEFASWQRAHPDRVGITPLAQRLNRRKMGGGFYGREGS